MHFSAVMVSLGAILLHLVPPALGAGDFMKTCSNIQLDSSAKYRLLAECRDTAGKKHCSRLDMTKCIANDNGNLVAALGSDDIGGFTSSCRHDECKIQANNPHKYSCPCKNNRDTYVYGPALDLNDFVWNSAGFMNCKHANSASCGDPGLPDTVSPLPGDGTSSTNFETQTLTVPRETVITSATIVTSDGGTTTSAYVTTATGTA